MRLSELLVAPLLSSSVVASPIKHLQQHKHKHARSIIIHESEGETTKSPAFSQSQSSTCVVYYQPKDDELCQGVASIVGNIPLSQVEAQSSATSQTCRDVLAGYHVCYSNAKAPAVSTPLADSTAVASFSMSRNSPSMTAGVNHFSDISAAPSMASKASWWSAEVVVGSRSASSIASFSLQSGVASMLKSSRPRSVGLSTTLQSEASGMSLARASQATVSSVASLSTPEGTSFATKYKTIQSNTVWIAAPLATSAGSASSELTTAASIVPSVTPSASVVPSASTSVATESTASLAATSTTALTATALSASLVPTATSTTAASLSSETSKTLASLSTGVTVDVTSSETLTSTTTALGPKTKTGKNQKKTSTLKTLAATATTVSTGKTSTKTTAGTASTHTSGATTAGTASTLTSRTTSAGTATTALLAATASTTSQNVYKTYLGNGTLAAGWPSTEQWMSFSDMFETNRPLMESSCNEWNVTANSNTEMSEMRSAILSVGNETSVDPRFILAVVMQESKGCVRVITTNGSHLNPGLMQSYNGIGTCNNNVTVATPCPAVTIKQMIIDGVNGTDSGPGLVQNLAAQIDSSDTTSKWYRAARLYNGGALAPNEDDLMGPCCTASYASDIANRLMGWTTGNNTFAAPAS